jgi:hypothetical protein
MTEAGGGLIFERRKNPVERPSAGSPLIRSSSRRLEVSWPRGIDGLPYQHRAEWPRSRKQGWTESALDGADPTSLGPQPCWRSCTIPTRTQVVCTVTLAYTPIPGPRVPSAFAAAKRGYRVFEGAEVPAPITPGKEKPPTGCPVGGFV